MIYLSLTFPAAFIFLYFPTLAAEVSDLINSQRLNVTWNFKAMVVLNVVMVTIKAMLITLKMRGEGGSDSD